MRGAAMPFVSLLSTNRDSTQALAEIHRQFVSRWSGPIDVALVFFSPHHLSAAQRIADHLAALEPRALLGCPGETVIADDREIEGDPALCVWLGRWAQPIAATPFQLAMEQTSEGYSL